jgi:hypothetical protein
MERKREPTTRSKRIARKREREGERERDSKERERERNGGYNGARPGH